MSDIYLLPVDAGCEPKGEAKPLTSDRGNLRGFDWTPDGKRIVFSSNRGDVRSLWWVGASGGMPERVGVGGGGAWLLAIARHGNRLVFTQYERSSDIWRMAGPMGNDLPASQRAPHRLASSTTPDLAPQFSADGQQIAFASNRTGSEEVWICDSDGANPVQVTSLNPRAAGDPRWSPDGRHIAFGASPEGEQVIHVLKVEDETVREFAAGVRPSWSRDGRWIYYGSPQTGQWQIWKKPFQGGDAVQVTKKGGREAFESFDGQHVYYSKTFGVEGIWRVPVEGGEEDQVLDHGLQGQWALMENGICLVNRNTVSDPVLEFLSFASGSLKEVGSFPEKGTRIAVSPDGRWLLYHTFDEQSSLVLVENFQ